MADGPDGTNRKDDPNDPLKGVKFDDVDWERGLDYSSPPNMSKRWRKNDSEREVVVNFVLTNIKGKTDEVRRRIGEIIATIRVSDASKGILSEENMQVGKDFEDGEEWVVDKESGIGEPQVSLTPDTRVGLRVIADAKERSSWMSGDKKDAVKAAIKSLYGDLFESDKVAEPTKALDVPEDDIGTMVSGDFDNDPIKDREDTEESIPPEPPQVVERVGSEPVDYRRILEEVMSRIRVDQGVDKTIISIDGKSVEVPHGGSGKPGKNATSEQIVHALRGGLRMEARGENKSVLMFDGHEIGEIQNGRDGEEVEIDYDHIVDQAAEMITLPGVEVDYGRVINDLRPTVSEMVKTEVDRDGIVSDIFERLRGGNIGVSEDRVREMVDAAKAELSDIKKEDVERLVVGEVKRAVEQFFIDNPNPTIDQFEKLVASVAEKSLGVIIENKIRGMESRIEGLSSEVMKKVLNMVSGIMKDLPGLVDNSARSVVIEEVGDAFESVRTIVNTEIADKLEPLLGVTDSALAAVEFAVGQVEKVDGKVGALSNRVDQAEETSRAAAERAEMAAKTSEAASEIAKQVEETVSEFQQKLDGGEFVQQVVDALMRANPDLDPASLKKLVSDYVSNEMQSLNRRMKTDIETEVKSQLVAQVAAQPQPQPQAPTPSKLKQMIIDITKSVVSDLLKDSITALTKVIVAKIRENKPDPVDVDDLAAKVSAILAVQQPVVSPPESVDVDDLAARVAAILAAQSSSQSGAAEQARRLQESNQAASGQAPAQSDVQVNQPASAPVAVSVSVQQNGVPEITEFTLDDISLAKLKEILSLNVARTSNGARTMVGSFDLDKRDSLRVAFDQMDRLGIKHVGKMLDDIFPVKSRKDQREIRKRIKELKGYKKGLDNAVDYFDSSYLQDLRTMASSVTNALGEADVYDLKDQKKELRKKGAKDSEIANVEKAIRNALALEKLRDDGLKKLFKNLDALINSGVITGQNAVDIKRQRSLFDQFGSVPGINLKQIFEDVASVIEGDAFARLIENIDDKFNEFDKELDEKTTQVKLDDAEIKGNRKLSDEEFAKKVFEHTVAKQNPDLELAEVSERASRQFLDAAWTLKNSTSLNESINGASNDLLATMGEVAFKEKFLSFEYQAAGRTYKPFEGLQPSDFETPELIDRLFTGGRLGLKDGFFALVAMEKFSGAGTKQYNAIRENVLKLLLKKEGLTQLQAVKAFEDKKSLFNDIFDKVEESRLAQDKYKNEKIRTKVKIANRRVRLGQIKKRRYMEALEDAGVAEDGVIDSALVSRLRLKINYASHSEYINKIGTKALNAPLWAIEEGLAKPVVGFGGWAAAQPLNVVDWAAGTAVRWGVRYPFSLLRAPGYVLTHPWGVFRPFKTLNAAGGSVAEGWKKVDEGKAAGKNRRVGRGAGWKKAASDMVNLKTDMNKWGEGEDSDNSVAALEQTVTRLDKKIGDTKVSLGIDVDLNFDKYKQDVKKAA